MKKHRLKKLYGSRVIRRNVLRIAGEIDADAVGGSVTLVGVLKGSFVFLADLVRAMRTPATVDFITVSSYGHGTAAGTITLLKDFETPIKGRNVILVDDIVDTGRTTGFIRRHIMSRRPLSCRICALLDKPSRRQVEVAVDYRGFTVPDRFIVGYGLDINERYRHLPDLYTVEEG